MGDDYLDGLLDTALIDVYQKAPTKDTSGGQVPGFQLVTNLTNLPASIQPTTGQPVQTLGQRQVFLSHWIFMNSNYGIQRGWKLQNTVTGESYVVHAIVDMGGQGEAYRFDCVQET